MLAAAALVLAAAAFAGGCVASAKGPNLLRGGISYAGGPAGADKSETRQPGKVRLYRGLLKVAEDKVASGEAFEFSVARAKYRLSVDLGSFDCKRDVRVDAPLVEANLECLIK